MLLAALLAVSAQDAPAAAESRLPLSVLYAGDPELERARDWSEFLRENFARTKTILLDDLSDAAAAEFDVVVADWRSRGPAKSGNPSDREPQGGDSRAWLPRGFTRPVVAIGAVGGELGRSVKLHWF